MPPVRDPAFEQFVAQRNKDLRRISSRTQGEYELSDVISEAWVMACDLRDRKGIAVDFLERSFQDLLISHLYQHFVRYTEKNVRYAVRLDHAAPGDEQDGPHPLTHMLASDDGQHPLAMLIAQETQSARKAEIDDCCSLASAYVRLLQHFDNKMPAVARHLLISTSYAYRRRARAWLLASCQNSLVLRAVDKDFIPRPWRRFRVQRIPFQRPFDFDEKLPLEATSESGPPTVTGTR